MANEAKTAAVFRQMLREKGYYSGNAVLVEEQQSENPRIDKLLRAASKRGVEKGYPDFILSSKAYPELLLVVEAKADPARHESETRDQYAAYAVDGALLYASFLSKEFDVLAMGISGEDAEHFRISHYLHLKGERKAYPIFGGQLLTMEEYFDGINRSNYKFDQDYGKLIAYTKTLNDTLHAKKIKESQRALLISGILIALKDRAFRAGYKQHETTAQLLDALYTSIRGQLSRGEIPPKRVHVLTQAFSFIRTNPTLSDEKNGKTFLENLIDEIDQEINGFMITHQYVDTVSQFYIEFLRYANNDKGLGIVLTPPHITELFVELADVDHNSVVFDNCCGTGGFLISAMKRMLEKANGDKAKEREITGKQLIGVEYQDDIFTLLISNMIIHRDGRTNLYWGDCFQKAEEIRRTFRPTVGFLNPPYKTMASDREELEFVLNNLEALEPGGTCIAILPLSCVIERTAAAVTLKQRILQRHTLEAVLSMPEDLFYNSKVSTVTCTVILTAHKPHPKGKKTWFAYCRDDGFIKVKNKGLIDANHQWDAIREKWINAYRNREVIPGFSVMREVKEKDEWCVEAYLETDYSVLTVEDYQEVIRNFFAFHISRAGSAVWKEAKTFEKSDHSSVPDWMETTQDLPRPFQTLPEQTGRKTCPLHELFHVRYGVNLELNALEQTRHGINFVSRTSKHNGVSAQVSRVPGVQPLPAGSITVAGGGSVMEAFLQAEPYYSGRDLYYLTPKVEMSSEVKLFYCLCLRRNKYKFSYGRQANETLADLPVPTLESIPDYVRSMSMKRYAEELILEIIGNL